MFLMVLSATAGVYWLTLRYAAEVPLPALSRKVEIRNDMLGVLESQLCEQAVKKKLMPTMTPVAAPFNASSFGGRIDPFSGQWAMHEAIGFLADAGSPVAAAAGGVVV